MRKMALLSFLAALMIGAPAFGHAKLLLSAPAADAHPADPLLSLLVSFLILRSAWALTRESADVLLESAPARFDVSQVEACLLGHVPGLAGVHHVHVWSMTGERPTVTLHADLEPGTEHRTVITAIHARLETQLRVEHCTVQIEEGECATPACVEDGKPQRHR